MVLSVCMATIGQVGNAEQSNIKVGKAAARAGSTSGRRPGARP